MTIFSAGGNEKVRRIRRATKKKHIEAKTYSEPLEQISRKLKRCGNFHILSMNIDMRALRVGVGS